MWNTPKVDEEFLRRMNDVLELYERPYNQAEPVVCVDEKSKQLLAEVRPLQEARPGKIRRRDSEYKRNGTTNIFCAVEPKAGKHITQVTDRRTKKDFALFLQGISGTYPDAETIHLVMDNLNIHFIGSVLATFPEEEALKLWRRFTVHHTPNHASWLNQAEIQIGLLTREALGKQRLASKSLLRKQVRAWTRNANKRKRIINWKFSRKQARVKFGTLSDII